MQNTKWTKNQRGDQLHQLLIKKKKKQFWDFRESCFKATTGPTGSVIIEDIIKPDKKNLVKLDTI